MSEQYEEAYHPWAGLLEKIYKNIVADPREIVGYLTDPFIEISQIPFVDGVKHYLRLYRL
jgi:hypothetical protein